MKITAKLAYSQLKVNRSRTRWTVVAITLSAALFMAVCSFISSGNELLVELLGDDYGTYGKSYSVLLMIPAVILGMLVMAMSVTVISNVFRISTQERVTQFGVMKCTGATRKQITDTVMYESIWLCIIGIPAGLCVGVALAVGGVHVANYLLEDVNALAHMMVTEISLSLHFQFSWKAALASILLCFVTVMYSAWKPAHKAAGIPAIDCIRGGGEIKTDNRRLRENRFIKKIFGFEGILADKNLKRNHRNFRATVIALSVGTVLFVSLGGLGAQADALIDYMSPDEDGTVIAEYMSIYEDRINEKTGKRERLYPHPVDSARGNLVAQKLAAYENTSVFGMGSDNSTYYTILPKEQVTEEMRQAFEDEVQKDYEFPVEIITLDEENYLKLCEKANAVPGSTLLLNHYRYNDFGNKTDVTPFSSSVENLTLLKADGGTLKMQIGGMLTLEQIPQSLVYPNIQPVRLIVPDAVVRGFSWSCSPTDTDGFMAYANQVLEEVFPGQEAASYMEDGFNTRVYKMNDYIKIMNIAMTLAAVFMYSFAVLLMLIGLTNVVGTLSTNVLMRKKEFAVLKSVGMTPESLRRMLNYESILCSAKALFYGVPIGIAVTLLINLPVRAMFPIPYEMPWMSIALCVLAVLLITLGTTRYAVRKLRSQNIIEAIRAESGR